MQDDILTWYDDPSAPQVAVPGVNGTLLYEDAPRIVGATWKLASWLSAGHFRILSVDGSLAGKWRWDEAPLPAGLVIALDPADHEHCFASFCAVRIDRTSDPETQLAWYSQALNRWLCRGCHDAIVEHIGALREGLRARGFTIDGG